MGAGREGCRHHAGVIGRGGRSYFTCPGLEPGPFQTPNLERSRLKAGTSKPTQARANRARHAVPHRLRRSAICSIAIRAAGVTTSVNTVAKARPKTMAVERLIHHCVDGAPTVMPRDRNSTFTPKAIGSTPSTAVVAVSTTGRARSRQVSKIGPAGPGASPPDPAKGADRTE